MFSGRRRAATSESCEDALPSEAWNALPLAAKIARVRPVAVDHVGPDHLRIRWADGREDDYRARQLRLACPCAGCVEEWTGRALLAPTSVPLYLTVLAVEPVGRYALTFTFSDGHHTGIFSWELLRRLAEAESEGGEDDGGNPTTAS